MAPRFNKERRSPARSLRIRREPVAKRRRRAGEGEIPPEIAAELDGLFDAIEADVNALVRLRQWKELERLLRFLNRTLGTRGAYWLHYSLLRLVVRQWERLTEPTEIAQWAHFVVEGYELLRSRIGVGAAIEALVEAQKPNPAVERFLGMGLAGTSEVVN